MNIPVVSVIIPVYNVKDYLEECVVSVINQTYENLEIILVDDGSKDGSGELCDQFRKTDTRIKVIHKNNGGLSDARNVGLKEAKGEFIAFIDSDDYVSTIFIESLMENILKFGADMSVLVGGTDFWDGELQPILDQAIVLGECISGKEALEKMLYMKIATGAQFKLCRKYIFDDVTFPLGYLYEDVATTYKLFIKSSKVVVVNSNLYAYRKRSDSIIRKKFNNEKMICLKIADQMLEDIYNYDSSLYNAAIARAFGMVYNVYLQVPEDDMKNRLLLWNWIKKYRLRILLNPNKMMRVKNRMGAVVSFLGMKISLKIGKKYGQKDSMRSNVVI